MKDYGKESKKSVEPLRAESEEVLCQLYQQVHRERRIEGLPSDR